MLVMAFLRIRKGVPDFLVNEGKSMGALGDKRKVKREAADADGSTLFSQE